MRYAYLQFDVKLQAIENLHKSGVDIVPVITIINGIRTPTHFRFIDMLKKMDKTFGATGKTYGKVGADRTRADVDKRRADRWNVLMVAGGKRVQFAKTEHSLVLRDEIITHEEQPELVQIAGVAANPEQSGTDTDREEVFTD